MNLDKELEYFKRQSELNSKMVAYFENLNTVIKDLDERITKLEEK